METKKIIFPVFDKYSIGLQRKYNKLMEVQNLFFDALTVKTNFSFKQHTHSKWWDGSFFPKIISSYCVEVRGYKINAHCWRAIHFNFLSSGKINVAFLIGGSYSGEDTKDVKKPKNFTGTVGRVLKSANKIEGYLTGRQSHIYTSKK